jgi:predicted RNA binding protein YcfA (HicA-like mRNA interferase family)
MKRKKLIQMLEGNGWCLKREGASHSIYTNGTANEPIPRHVEIDEILAQAIIKRRGLK